jgi:hypothetical protein
MCSYDFQNVTIFLQTFSIILRIVACFVSYLFVLCVLRAPDARADDERALERTARALADVTTEVDWDDDPLMMAAARTVCANFQKFQVEQYDYFVPRVLFVFVFYFSTFSCVLERSIISFQRILILHVFLNIGYIGSSAVSTRRH